MTNRLASETSPYLLQHRDNPVHWWSWGEEALAEARATNRPILLSIGYAACHWCHVMAHESFEDGRIAQVMNKLFVNIKVDREERPDLDGIYQQALAHMGQHGGWPLTMFCTPDGKPFWGGTYFPPTARWGRPGFPDILRAVSDQWANHADRVAANVEALAHALTNDPASGSVQAVTLDMLDQGAEAVLGAVDMDQGGLSGAPKFPQPGLFDFLWRAYRRNGNDTLAQAVTLTLRRICQGGITDHLGGGFMRYSTDESWLVPHFEKMLYDNAQMIDLLTLVWSHTGEDLFKTRVEECVGWLLREMRAEADGFAATLDADSDGGEGKFYTWSAQDILDALGPDLAPAFAQAYDVSVQGNWEGVNILNRSMGVNGDETVLAQARAMLLNLRERRPRPGRDDKVLADWNGMIIAALARAGLVFDRADWIETAAAAFAGLQAALALPGDRLAHCLCQGKAAAIGFADDLAHMAAAALALYQVTGRDHYLTQARAWVAAADTHHWDQAKGGYFQAGNTATDIVARLKPIHDGAIPSANGIMVHVLAQLWQITGETTYADRARATVDAFSPQFNEHFAQMPTLLTATGLLADPVLVTLPRDRANDFVAVLRRTDPINRVVAWTGSGDATVCRHSTCSAPLAEPADLALALKGV